jgi:hypothetical protein
MLWNPNNPVDALILGKNVMRGDEFDFFLSSEMEMAADLLYYCTSCLIEPFLELAFTC